MSGYRHGAHTVFMIHLHLVWITKYRKPVLRGDVAHRVRDLIRAICRAEHVEILKGHLSKDHRHLFVSIPPQGTISRLVQRLKGKSSHRLLSTCAHLRTIYWGRHLWARGSFCCRSGNGTDDVIKAYIDQQMHDTDTELRIEGEEPPQEEPPSA